jgi:leucyl aminopeptidase
MMKFEAALLKAKHSTNTDVIFAFQTPKGELAPIEGTYQATLKKQGPNAGFTGKIGQTLWMRQAGLKGAENVLFVGLGKTSELTFEKARVAGGATFAKISSEKVNELTLHSDAWTTDVEMLRAFAEGFALNDYKFDKYLTSKSAKAKDGDIKLTFGTADAETVKNLTVELSEVTTLLVGVNITRDWSNEPSNIGIPAFYAAEAKKLAKKYGLKVTVLGPREIKKEKMELFMSVAQGSDREPYVIVLEYSPKKARKPKTIALVGKGITFDSGGISIKPSLRMEEMKHDMTGAATVVGAVVAAAELGLQHRVLGIIGMAENMPSGKANNPGSIIRTRNGKTVEVINTDAEGRLILADVLDYAQDFKPDCVVDLATLTGAVGVALGKQAAAILGNDDDLISQLINSGSHCGERLWQLPTWDEYLEDMRADHADLRNSCNDSNGGTIRGAMFLKQFIRKEMPWAHLDIASMANGLTSISYLPKKGASGIYVRTLVNFIENYS